MTTESKRGRIREASAEIHKQEILNEPPSEVELASGGYTTSRLGGPVNACQKWG
jgi:hypothetical protein